MLTVISLDGDGEVPFAPGVPVTATVSWCGSIGWLGHGSDDGEAAAVGDGDDGVNCCS